MKEDTRIVHAGRDPERNHGVVNPAVYHASTIIYPSVGEVLANYPPDYHTTFYGRQGTPTTFAFEQAMTELEQGYRTLVAPSGMAAISTALLAYLSAGDHLLMVDSVYAPTRRFCDGLLKRMGVEVTYYDPLIGAGIETLLRENTRVVFTESPGSHTFEVQDVPAIAAAAHAHGASVLLDNTWATPIFFKAFEHGVDVSIQAATKYVVGHSDAMLGSITTNEACWKKLARTHLELGVCAAPDDLYLGQRGLRTLGVRLRQHEQTALTLARWLADRPEIERVLHPALPSCPGHQTWKRDFTGSTGLFSVVLADRSFEAVTAMVDGFELFALGGSWGGYESLVLPSHPAPPRTAVPWNPKEGLVRFHAGLEDVDDLIRDLEAGLSRLRKGG
jgi:cystathionine beta-lyase